jgi:hypothetical protein
VSELRERGWYAWANRNPSLACDAQSAFGAGFDLAMSTRLAGTVRWSQVVPVMRETLDALERAELWFAVLREPATAMRVPVDEDDEDLEDLPF